MHLQKIVPLPVMCKTIVSGSSSCGADMQVVPNQVTRGSITDLGTFETVSCAVHVDLRKAFDSANHSVHCWQKLSRIFPKENSRLRSTKKNIKSSMKTVVSGVSQGSIHGSTLFFLLFTIDLSNSNVMKTVRLADHAVLV